MTPNAVQVARLALVAGASALLAGCVVPPPASAPPRPRPVFVEPGAAPRAEPAGARMFFYPERGQAAEQMERDRFECYRWAVRESGHDPGMTPLKPPPRQASPEQLRDGSQVAGSAAVGAITGAALSGPRHMGEGAVIGAIFGAVLGSAAQESRAQAIESRQEARAAQQQQRQVRQMEPFRRAMGACMSGRGYRVG